MDPATVRRFRRISVIGGGLMGTQIALQVALKGFEVCLIDRDPQAIARFVSMKQEDMEILRQRYFFLLDELPDPVDRLARAMHQIEASTDLKAASGCDLVIEAISENTALKRSLFAELNQICSPETIFATNSSSILPGDLASHTGRPERFLALHFSYKNPAAELMPHPTTSAETLTAVDAFSRKVCELTVHCRKQSRGHILNRILMGVNAIALDLAIDEIASPEDIDRIFMHSYGSRHGPFGVLDAVGLDTSLAITEEMARSHLVPGAKRRAEYLRKYVDRGHLGEKSGIGFYRYPNPAYSHPSFVKNGIASPPDSSGGGLPPDQVHSWPVAPASELHTMGRFGLRMVDAPLADHMVLRDGHEVLRGAVIVGDNSTADALEHRLQQQQRKTFRIRTCGDAADALKQMDNIWATADVPDLFLVTARDAAATLILNDADAWQARRDAGVIAPYLLCQRWFRHVHERRLTHEARLVGMTGLGGDFGFCGGSSAAEGGAISGLLKALRKEIPDLSLVKVIDAGWDEPPECVVDATLRELLARTSDVEVGYLNGRRHIVRGERQHPATLPQRRVTSGSVWVVTGIDSGMTAACARAFAQRHRLKLHLLGTNPPPPADGHWHTLSQTELYRRAVRDAQRRGRSKGQALDETRRMLEIGKTLQACHDDGVQATYHACDIGDPDALDSILEGIRRGDGPIRGIIHGSGAETGLPLLMTPERSLEQTVHGTLDGAAALMRLTRDDPLEFFIGSGRSSSRFGTVRSAGNSLADHMLAKLLGAFACVRPDCTGLAIHWTAWDEVAMGVRPENHNGLEQSHGWRMPVQEGVAHFIEAIETDTEDHELLLISDPSVGVLSPHVAMSATD